MKLVDEIIAQKLPESKAETSHTVDAGVGHDSAESSAKPVEKPFEEPVEEPAEEPAAEEAVAAPPSPVASQFSDYDFIDVAEGEYHVQQSQDTDYGAVDEGFIDTQIASYNTGNTPNEWTNCVNFFRIKAPPSGTVGASPTKTRVPVDKLPGMSVGLFDYQYMAVFKLLGLAYDGLSGGFLADEQGLGKTQEMFGIVAAGHNIRKSKTEVMAARKSKKPSRHNAPGTTATRCPLDARYGVACYCYSQKTQRLADAMPEGPTVIIVPARSCSQILREAKAKLDLKTFKVRMHHETAAKEDKLTPAEIRTLTAAIAAKTAPDGTVDYHYQASPGLSDFIIITSPESLSGLTNGLFGVNIKVGDEVKKRDGLMPGIVMLDEFHEYFQPATGKSRPHAWLEHLKRSCRGPNQPTPLVYFVSGTPFNDSPGDIQSAVSLLEREAWADETHRMAAVTTASLERITTAFDALCKAQAEGLELLREDIVDYRKALDGLLKRSMVRRLGTDSFRSQALTTLGPLSVNIIDHAVPAALLKDLIALAEATATKVADEAASRCTTSARFLRSDHAQPLLLKLRLASSFPGIATAAGAKFTFTTEEVAGFLPDAGNDPLQTPYAPLIAPFSSHSSKLASLLATVTTMLGDRTPIPGSPSPAKKLVIFTPLDAEAVLLHIYLHRRKAALRSLKDLKPVTLLPSHSAAERQAIIDKFLTPGNAPPNVLIAPIYLAGTGLNLQAAKYSVLMGPAWTKRENQQAYYRVHRVGQRQTVNLSLLTARWNPAERVILGRYEGREVAEEGMWELEAGDEEGKGLVERHQGTVE
ncbi:hypothetical protein QBC34DRAFT_307637 [Podospora aff. communis PSN243]|uniref:Helicase C-terminal domain-containing protein n=1 Tax=Podospora aff. communis PSN243 TaxID=3040156 RepID=A0AAV9GAH0_9PEZI|nr:hypothetical protein QBC34DRAFT_307637 [Podospora aff. communis PSN243]